MKKLELLSVGAAGRQWEVGGFFVCVYSVPGGVSECFNHPRHEAEPRAPASAPWTAGTQLMTAEA